MAKKQQPATPTDKDLDIGEVYSRTELFLEKHKRTVTLGVVGLLVVVGGLLGYRKFVSEPQAREAAELMWKAEYWFEIDSLELAINGDGNHFGFAFIADRYGSTPSGRLAHFYMGSIFMKQEEYQAAIDHYRQAKVKDDVLRVMAVGNIGDALVELGRLDEAAKQFEKAASMAKNDFTTPLYLMKAGIVYQELGNMKAATKAFARIADEFPTSTEGNAARKYLGRTRVLAG
jgi:tetratricopeptide (TPR) repeat protein